MSSRSSSSSSSPFISSTVSTSNLTCVNTIDTVIPDEDCEFLTTAALVFVIVSIVVIIFGIVINSWLLFILLSKHRKNRTVPDILIVNMSVLAVLMFVVVAGSNAILFSQVAFQVKFTSNVKLDKAILYFQVFISIASFATLVVLALDRFFAIVYPLLSRPYRTKRNALILCGCVWIVSGLSVLPIVINGGSRNFFENYSNPSFKPTVIVSTVFIYGLSITIFIACYSAILKVIWRNPIHRQTSARDQSTTSRIRKQRIKILKTVCIIITSNVVIYGYFFGVILWIACGGHTRVSARFSNALLYSSILVAYLNPCINPCVYAFHQIKIRRYLSRRKLRYEQASWNGRPLPSTRSEIRAREERYDSLIERPLHTRRRTSLC
ncbi:allatostatin-A receptor-like [Strongylocentrotus purpuratus]|uniref:G-protein coupled receptors family 1 profile domain-containing protein n=1 Tax=Strongylocentrotus purpuratus TaxID=7668 RepID=A0A7M7LSS5_STRPU|nr:allatostatin-A receptor-like [Strongylocentrotus purpuratus]